MTFNVKTFAALLVALLFAVPAQSQTFGPTSTLDSYTQELDVQQPWQLAGEIRSALVYDDFRVYRKTGEAVFLRKSEPFQMSGYINLYHEAVVWVRENGNVRVHVWRKRSNLASHNYHAWRMKPDEITHYQDLFNKRFDN